MVVSELSHPEMVSFGSAVRNSPVVIKTITIVNNENETKNLAPLITEGASTFQIIYSTCASVKKGKSCTLKVAMKTDVHGIKEGLMTIDSSSIVLMGNVQNSILEPEISILENGVEVIAVDYEEVSKNKIKTFVVKNEGDSQVSAPNVLISGDFSIISNKCTIPLKKGASCSLSILFSSEGKSANSYAGVLNIDGNIVNLSAQVVSSSPVLNNLEAQENSIAISEAIFGVVSKSSLKVLTIKNNSITNSSLLTSSVLQDFSVIYNSCNGKSLKSNATCIIKVIFDSKNKADGSYSESLEIGNLSIPLIASVGGPTSCPEGEHLDGGVCVQDTDDFSSLECSMSHYEGNQSSFINLFPNLNMNNVFNVKPYIKNTIFSTESAVAALTEDGAVKVWGASSNGGNQAHVDVFNFNNTTNKIKTIVPAGYSFAALMEDGTLRIWGGGCDQNCLDLIDSLNFNNTTNKIKELYGAQYEYAALMESGEIKVFGNGTYWQTNRINGWNLNNTTNKVKMVYNTNQGFAVLMEDGTVKVWGNNNVGGNQTQVNAHNFNNTTNKIKDIYVVSDGAFIAHLENGAVKVWGNTNYGGNQAQVDAHNFNNTTNKVVRIKTNAQSVAAILENGAVKVWGATGYGGDQVQVDAHNFNNTTNKIKELFNTYYSYAALMEDGTVKVWGHSEAGADQATVDALGFNNTTNKIKKISSTRQAFAALMEDGTVKVWGSSIYGGNQAQVDAHNFNNTTNKIKEIKGIGTSFIAIMEDGGLKVWGESATGGNQTQVDSHNLGSGNNIAYSPKACKVAECNSPFQPSSDGYSCE